MMIDLMSSNYTVLAIVQKFKRTLSRIIIICLYLDVCFLAGHFQIVPSPKFKMRNIEFRILGTFGGREIVPHVPKRHSNDHNSAAIRSTELILCMAYTGRPARNS